MPYIALGLVALVLLVFLAKAFVAANPANLAQGLRWAGVGIAVLGIGALTVTGRVGLASFLVPLVYWLVRRGWPPWARGDQAARPSPGPAPSGPTALLEPTPDPDRGR